MGSEQGASPSWVLARSPLPAGEAAHGAGWGAGHGRAPAHAQTCPVWGPSWTLNSPWCHAPWGLGSPQCGTFGWGACAPCEEGHGSARDSELLPGTWGYFTGVGSARESDSAQRAAGFSVSCSSQRRPLAECSPRTPAPRAEPGLRRSQERDICSVKGRECVWASALSVEVAWLMETHPAAPTGHPV